MRLYLPNGPGMAKLAFYIANEGEQGRILLARRSHTVTAMGSAWCSMCRGSIFSPTAISHTREKVECISTFINAKIEDKEMKTFTASRRSAYYLTLLPETARHGRAHDTRQKI
ncbi:unnamed protein product [Amoebophrya sp. A120]|nr:unnamed protein product [Amoebophrya sp. A120]|eukprot:GSA120T00013195001.1